MTNPSLQPDLLTRARRGEPDAFGQLFEPQAARVLLYIRLRLSAALGQRLEPEDVLQETGLAAFESIASFESTSPGAFGRWLCAIAENRLRDASDFHAALKRKPAGQAQPISLVLERVCNSVTGPHSQVAREEQHERLRAGLEALPQDEREALVLRFFCGATTTRIAKELGTSETGARRLLARATTHLGSGLEDLA